MVHAAGTMRRSTTFTNPPLDTINTRLRPCQLRMAIAGGVSKETEAGAQRRVDETILRKKAVMSHKVPVSGSTSYPTSPPPPCSPLCFPTVEITPQASTPPLPPPTTPLPPLPPSLRFHRHLLKHLQSCRQC